MAEYVRLALNGLNFEQRKKFHGTDFRDLFELSARADQYEKDSEARVGLPWSQLRDIATAEADIHPDVAAAKIINHKPCVCKAFVRVEPLK